MRAIIICIFFCLWFQTNRSDALEFKNFGTVGIGGAGVAKPPVGAEGYWNPAALGMQEERKALHSSILVDACSKGNLADDLDRLNSSTDYRTQPTLSKGPGTTETWDWIHAGMADNIVIAAPIIDIARHPENMIRAGGGTAVGMKFGRWGVGYYGAVMSSVHADSDINNILPDEDEVHPMTIAGFNNFGAELPRGPSNSFFSAAQGTALEKYLVSSGITPAAAQNIRYAIDYRFTVNNDLHMKPDEVIRALQTMVGVSASGSGDLIAKNQTLITTNALILNEVPVSYGRQFELGDFGTLAAGVSAKLMLARLYSTSFRAFMTNIEAVYQRLADTYRDGVDFGIDTGLIWTKKDVSLGVTAKNLNSPSFERAEGGRLVVRPSVRAGVNYEPTEWLRTAVDIDLTRSSELTPNMPIQMLGGGVELKPLGWSLVRLGCYKNIATDDPAAITAGIGYADESVTFSVDGAYGLGNTNFRGGNYTNEAQLQFSLGIAF